MFSKNCVRLLEGDLADLFFTTVLAMAQEQGLTSDEHFTAGDAGNPNVDFHGERRTRQIHQFTTDPDARLYRKGKG